MVTIDSYYQNPFQQNANLAYTSLLLFHSDIQKSLEDVISSRLVLVESPLMADQVEYVRPTECDQAIANLRKIEMSVTRISRILKHLNNLQSPYISNRYKLLMHLYSTNDHVSTVVESLRQFRAVCSKSTMKNIRSQNTIQNNLLAITHGCEKIEKEAEQLLDNLLLLNSQQQH